MMDQPSFPLQHQSKLLSLPLELLFLILGELPIPSILSLASTSRITNQLLKKEILAIPQKEYIRRQAQYHENSSIIRYNLTLLKDRYKQLHPDYISYRALKEGFISEKEKTLKVLENGQQNKLMCEVFLRYPEFYYQYLPSHVEGIQRTRVTELGNHYIKHFVMLIPTDDSSASPVLKLLFSEVLRNQLQSFRYFISQLIASEYLSHGSYLEAVKVWKLYGEDYKSAADYLERTLGYSFLYSNSSTYQKEFEKKYNAYSVVKGLLMNIEQKKVRQQLCQYIKNQAERPLPRHPISAIYYIEPVILAMTAHYITMASYDIYYKLHAQGAFFNYFLQSIYLPLLDSALLVTAAHYLCQPTAQYRIKNVVSCSGIFAIVVRYVCQTIEEQHHNSGQLGP